MAIDPVKALGELVQADKDRITRLWIKRVKAETHGLNVAFRDLAPPLGQMVHELARLLLERPDDVVRLWPEQVRTLGPVRYDQRFDAADLARELKALQLVLLRVYARHYGHVEPEVATLLAELIGEATASVQASYARALRTEEVRFKEAALMESILHHVDIGMLLAERDGSVSYVTPAVSRLMGLPAHGLVGTDALAAALAQVSARHPDGSPFRIAEMPYVRALKKQAPVADVWLVVRRPQGRDVVLEMAATPIWEDRPGSALVGVLQTMTDRTETSQKARELSSANDELRRLQARLMQRTRTQALGQLASGAAHALNNFLNVLSLRVALLRREFNQGHLDALERTVRSIGDLVARLQEFSSARAEEDVGPADLDQVVQDSLSLVQPELLQEERPVHLETRLEAHAWVRVDEALLRELLINLLLAARDRTPPGGTVELVTLAHEGSAVLRIRDGGRPFEDEELAQLFEPLLGKTKTPQVSLLLAVGRNQANRWGGELLCQNAPEGMGGGEFVLRLPMTQAAEMPAPPAPRESLGGSRPSSRRTTPSARRVLVVDDDVDNARMLAEVLGEEGYQVSVAHDAKTALGLWKDRDFDAALLDALMPDISGWELASQLRERSPDVLLAMITGGEIRGQNRKTLALLDAVFRKPIDVGALDDFLSQPVGQGGAEEGAALHS